MTVPRDTALAVSHADYIKQLKQQVGSARLCWVRDPEDAWKHAYHNQNTIIFARVYESGAETHAFDNLLLPVALQQSESYNHHIPLYDLTSDQENLLYSVQCDGISRGNHHSANDPFKLNGVPTFNCHVTSFKVKLQQLPRTAATRSTTATSSNSTSNTSSSSGSTSGSSGYPTSPMRLMFSQKHSGSFVIRGHPVNLSISVNQNHIYLLTISGLHVISRGADGACHELCCVTWSDKVKPNWNTQLHLVDWSKVARIAATVDDKLWVPVKTSFQYL